MTSNMDVVISNEVRDRFLSEQRRSVIRRISELSNCFLFGLSSSNDLNDWNGAQRWNYWNGLRY
jgi:hypothetical protein